MKKALFSLFLFTLFTTSLFSRQLGLEISYANYMTAEKEPYLELYFALSGSSLTLKQNDNGSFQGGIQVLVKFNQDSTIKAADKFRILSPEIKDSSKVTDVFIQQARYALPNGIYSMQIELFDINNPDEKYNIKQKVKINIEANRPTASDLVFLDSYTPAKENSIYAKSGYDLIPIVASGVNYFPESIDKISFYTELYNLNKSLADGEDYLLKQYIENADNGKIVDKHASFSKKKATDIQPVLSGFKIDELPTGNYYLVVEALNKEGKSIFKRSEFFFRNNNSVEPLIESVMPSSITGTFVDAIDDFDSLYQYIKYLYPISVEVEQDFQKELLATRNKKNMKSYFYAFWKTKNPENPEGQWREYHKNVKIANKLYATRLRPGYMSSRGRVFLAYGSPDLVEDRRREPSLPPYQMWQYNQINSPYVLNQNNKIFIFAEFEMSTNDYELIHSTAYGELNNRRWQYDLAQGIYGPSDNLDQNRINSGDDFGSRINNNIIFQSR